MNDEAAARRLGQMLREGGDPAPGAARNPELTRLLAAVSQLQPAARTRSRRWQWTAVAAAATLVAVLAVFMVARRDLTYEVLGSARVNEQGIEAASDSVHVRFSDGSSFELSPGAELRVGESTPNGSKLSLLRGKLTANVVHGARSRWSVAAGPFEVVVVGTRFAARWDAELQRVFVELHEGAVEVRGGGLSAPVVVRAGQRLEAGTSRDDWRLTALSSRLAQPAEPPPQPLEVASAAPPPGALPPPSASANWPALLSRSDFAAIVEQAQTMGVDRCLATCSPANLRALADAARYTGKFELAERSLLALRRRSPAQAAAAGFFLGRLYESRGRSAEALKMYEQHLAEAPRGDYAEEAMAGRMRTLVRTGDRARARQAADSYLRQFPRGVHAASAGRVLDGAGTP